jgi:hypothetical protein
MLPGAVAVVAVAVSQLAGGELKYWMLGFRGPPDGVEVTDTDCGWGLTPAGVLNETWLVPVEYVYVWAARGLAPANNSAVRNAIALLDETFCIRLIGVLSLSKIRSGMHVLDQERTSPAQIAYRKIDGLRRHIEQLVLKK